MNILRSTLTKRKRAKHEKNEHLFEVSTSCYTMFTYCVPSSEDGRGQFLMFVFMSFATPLSEVRRSLNAHKQYCCILFVSVHRDEPLVKWISLFLFFTVIRFIFIENLNWPILVSFFNCFNIKYYIL